MISRLKFLESIFRDLKAAEAVAHGTTMEHEGRVVYPVRPWTPGAAVLSRATHFSVGAVFKDQAAKFARQKGYLSGAYCLVLNDIHEKAAPPGIAPTWKMPTKPGSEQWGYDLWEPFRDEQAFDDLIAAFIGTGHGILARPATCASCAFPGRSLWARSMPSRSSRGSSGRGRSPAPSTR